ncbi:MAG TPA: ABC transporter permease [Thermoanaerobaculia bacterium]|nr:ABC transporter permease [Thermoanaerobaculia bacterium]
MINTLRELFRSRQLIAALTSRDLKARYRGSVLGYFWSLANPLLLLTVYTVVFTHFFPRPEIRPYALFLFTGILPWTFFSGAVLEASTSITSNGGLIKKVMFPAETLPLVVVFAHLVHFVLALPILFLALAIAVLAAGTDLTWTLALAPVILLVQTIFVAGVALVVASASVLFRDLRDIVANLLNLGFFLTPILYSIHSAFIADWVRILLRANPMTPFVLTFQDVFFHARVPATTDVVLMLVYAGASLALGLTVFERLRDTLAEAI